MKRDALIDRIDKLEEALLFPSRMTVEEFDSKLREWRNLQIQLNAENSTSLGEKILFTYIG